MSLDSHHHFWNYSTEEYGWIGEDMQVLRRDFGPDDLKPLLAEAGIEGVISVQARTDLKENDFLCGYASEYDFVKGVVGWVDLTKADVGDDIARFAEMTKAVGLREVLQGMEDDAYCLREDFLHGLGQLHDFGLVYDILIFHRHLPNAIKMVDCNPVQPFVLDHVAKPKIESNVPDPEWVKNMKALGERENVSCKISGMVTEVSAGMEWTPDLLRPYFETAVQAFGTDRILFGSDWPVCLLRSEYGKWAETVRGWTDGWSEGEKAALFGGNAARVYGVG